MPEILVYQDQWLRPTDPGHTPLKAAIEELNRNVGKNDSTYRDVVLHNRPRKLSFVTVDVVDLITTGLGGLQDNLAAQDP